jgi:N-acetylmuramoyl-L-alanine amidase
MYWDLQYISKAVGLDFSWIEKGNQVRLQSERTSLIFRIHKRDYLHNGSKVYLGYAVAAHKGSLYISRSDFRKVLIPLLVSSVIKSPPKLYRIVIDPGHGGKDPGTSNKRYGLYEKDLVLDVAKLLRKELQSKGYKVYLTRESDAFISLSKRADISNKLDADLFISLHFNSTGTSSVEGVETYVYTPPYQPSSSRTNITSSDKIIHKGNANDDWNVILGFLTQRQLVNQLGYYDRGLKKARFQVLRDIKAPGMLVELGFLSHDGTARSLRSSAELQRISSALSASVYEYQRMLNQLRDR